MNEAYLDENYLPRRENLFRVKLTARTTVSGKYVYSGQEMVPDPTALAGLAVANPGRSFDPTSSPLYEINNTQVDVTSNPIVWARLRGAEGGRPSYEFDAGQRNGITSLTKHTNTNRVISYGLASSGTINGDVYVDFTDGIAILEADGKPWLRLMAANSDSTMQQTELRRNRGIIDAYEAEWSGIKQFNSLTVMQAGSVIGTLTTSGQTQPKLTITGITNADPGVVTTSSAHGMIENDDILLSGISGISLSGIYRVGAPVTTTTFTLKEATTSDLVDTTSLGTFTAGSVIDCSWEPDSSRGVSTGIHLRPSDYDNGNLGTNGAQLWQDLYTGTTKIAAMCYGSDSTGHAIRFRIDPQIGDASGLFQVLMSSVHDSSLADTTLQIGCESFSIGMSISNGGGYFWINLGSFLAGASGSFTTVDGKTVTVTGGIITSIV